MHLLEKLLASWLIEVVQEVCEKDEVVVTAIIDVEGTARDGFVPVGYSSRLCILSCYGEDAGPIDCGDFSFWIQPGNGDSK